MHLLGRDEERTARAVSRIESRLLGAGERLVPELCDISDPSRGAAASPRSSWHVSRRSTCSSTTPASSRSGGSAPPTGLERTFATNVLGPFLLTGAVAAVAARRRSVTSDHGVLGRHVHGEARCPTIPSSRAGSSTVPPSTRTASAPRWCSTASGPSGTPATASPFTPCTPVGPTPAGFARPLPRFRRLMRPLLRDATQGADTIVWLATVPSLEPASGGFWHDRAPRPEHRVPVDTRDGGRARAPLGLLRARSQGPPALGTACESVRLTSTPNQEGERNGPIQGNSHLASPAQGRSGATSPTSARSPNGIPSVEDVRLTSGEPRTVGARYELEVSFLGSRLSLPYVTVEVEPPHPRRLRRRDQERLGPRRGPHPPDRRRRQLRGLGRRAAAEGRPATLRPIAATGLQPSR